MPGCMPAACLVQDVSSWGSWGLVCRAHAAALVRPCGFVCTNALVLTDRGNVSLGQQTRVSAQDTFIHMSSQLESLRG